MKSSVSQTQSTKKPINQAEEKNIKDVWQIPQWDMNKKMK